MNKLVDPIINGTIHIFNKILKDTRYSPSAKKFHYQFNLRDLSKVTEGIMLSLPDKFKGQNNKMISLWVAECRRVFEDRMISSED